ncbi:MAG: CxxC-x17-CxxC domain-containing protein [Candidatus Falkowbacteria bacterium]
MFRDDNRGFSGPREEYTGEWECSKCHAKTPHSLPFPPSSDRPVYCKNCYREMKQESGR